MKALIIFNGVDSWANDFSFYVVCEENEINKVIEDNYNRNTEICGYKVIKEIKPNMFNGVVKTSKRY